MNELSLAGYDAGPADNRFTTPAQRSRLTSLVETLSSTSHYLASSSQGVAWSATMCFVRYIIAYNHIIVPGQDICDLTLCGFVIFMAISGKHRSIRTYLSMGPQIIVENMGVPYHKPSQRPRLHRVLKSIDRIWGKAVSRKQPITIPHLRKMAKVVAARPTKLRVMIMTAILVAFFSLIRKSAFCAPSKTTFDPVVQLTVGDLRISGSRATITLQHTKTIQYSERDLEIHLPLLENDICPTNLLCAMLETRADAGPDTPLFVTDDQNTPLTDAVFRKEFSSLLKEAGIPTDKKSPHSLRRGGTSSAFESGCNPTCIKMQGDWASDAYLIYIWVTDALKTEVVKTWEAALR